MVVAGRGGERGGVAGGSSGERGREIFGDMQRKKIKIIHRRRARSFFWSCSFFWSYNFQLIALFDLMFALLTIDGVLVVARGWEVQKKKVNQQFKGGGKVQRMV